MDEMKTNKLPICLMYIFPFLFILVRFISFFIFFLRWRLGIWDP